MNHSARFLENTARIARQIDVAAVERVVALLARVREDGGRVFMLGVGGSAANASHAVNDFRKLAGLECYAPTDNVAELTARTNDDGWENVFSGWLRVSRLGPKDAVFVFSVGGGSEARGLSVNLVHALRLAHEVGARILGVVGRDGGFTATMADACVLVPMPDPDAVTPHTEAFQAVIWHLMVTHPALQRHAMAWETTLPPARVSGLE